MTIEQKQCLLCYLGYYDGLIDGKFGPATKAATTAFQQDYSLEADGKFGPLTEEKILQAVTGKAVPVPKEPDAPEISGTFWDSVKYFRKDEFRCKCGGKYCDGFPAEPSEKLVRLADRVREHYGVPVNISSGVRCEVHNAKVGGVSGSRHKIGTAMDFTVKGKLSKEVLEYVWKQPEVNYAYGIDGSYVHMDVE